MDPLAAVVVLALPQRMGKVPVAVVVRDSQYKRALPPPPVVAVALAAVVAATVAVTEQRRVMAAVVVAVVHPAAVVAVAAVDFRAVVAVAVARRSMVSTQELGAVALPASFVSGAGDDSHSPRLA
jgi:hypothetical protein